HTVTGNELDINNTGSVVAGVLACEERVSKNRGAQRIVRVEITTAYALVTQFLYAPAGDKAHVHPDLEEDVHNAGVLTDGTLAFGAHARVGQNLCNGVLGSRVLLTLIRARQVLNVVSRMVVADELDRVGDRLNEIVFFDQGSHDLSWGNREGKRLLAGPDGLTLFGKGSSALLGISGREDMGNSGALQVEHIGGTPIARFHDDLLGRLHRQGAVGSNGVCQFQGPFKRLPGLDQTIDQAVLMETLGREHVAGKNSFHGDMVRNS